MIGRHEFKYFKRWGRVHLNRLLGREFVELGRVPTLEVSGVCNLNCVFCAYKDKESGKVVTSNDDFARYVDELARMGHREIHLTPNTGDVFVDKHFEDKIDIIENHPDIEAYEFITNLIAARESILERIAEAKKLTRMYISLYGHDKASFEAITKRPGHQYDRLVGNLHRLAELGPRLSATIGSFLNTHRSIDWSPDDAPHADDSELMAAIRQVANRVPKFVWTGNHVDFDSWGGIITQADLDGLGMGFRLVGSTVPMTGPCGMLFGGSVVLADGRVNACACRAVKGDLIIGDANESPLSEILSPSNKRYREIVDAHMRGDYPEECRGCKIYSSIYRKPRGRKTTTVKTFMEAQAARCTNQSETTDSEGRK